MVGSCCEQVVKGVPLASSLQVFKEDPDLTLVGYHNNVIFTVKLPNDLGEVDRTPVQCYCQELTVKSGIISVFKWVDKYWILDCEGGLHQLCTSQVDTDSADLFDDEGICCVKKVRQLQVLDVVSATFIPPHFLAVLSYRKENSELLVTLHQWDTAETVQSLVVNQRIIRKPDRLFVEYVGPNDMEKEFVSNWFPHFNQTDPTRGYLFIYNFDELACCVQLGFEYLSIGFFFSWPSPCIFSSFRRPSLKDGVLHRNSLVLSFEDGAIIGFSCSGGEILHFTMSQTKCVAHVEGFLLSSDYTDCLLTPLNPVDTSSVLPLKGVISFCLLGDNKPRVLALTNHGGLYLLKAEVKRTEGNCQIPAVSSFQETVNNIEYLEDLNSRIAAQDSSIKCLATVVNSKNFRFKLDVHVVQIIADHHLFRVTCESLAADIGTSPVFRAKDWHIVFILSYTNHDRIIYAQRLPNDFSKCQPLEVMVLLNLETHDSRDCVVVVKLISFVGEGKYRPTLLIGKVRLNVLSFLEPQYSLLTHAASSSFKHPSVIDILRTQFIDLSNTHSSTKETKDLNLVLEIPTLGVGVQQIIERLLERSKALWRVNPWELNHSSSSVCVVVRNHKIFLDIAKDKATVSSDNAGLVILMKHAVLNIIGGPHINEFDEAVLMETENILQSLDVMGFSDESPTCQEVFDVYKRKVQLINDSLFRVSTHFG